MLQDQFKVLSLFLRALEQPIHFALSFLHMFLSALDTFTFNRLIQAKFDLGFAKAQQLYFLFSK